MAKGLTLARAFHIAGHRVIGADVESSGIFCSGRYSRALSRFYHLPTPDSETGGDRYVGRLVEIVKSEGIDLWVSCSGVGSAVEDACAKAVLELVTRCACIQLDPKITSILHDKSSFMREAKKFGLPVPETHDITSRENLATILCRLRATNPSRKFILKPVGVDDVNRGNMTLLPFESQLETEHHISRLEISPATPWILQQFIAGGEEYCSHALVVRGEVKCFVSCPSSELLMHYKALPPSSGLSRAMLSFTKQFITCSENPESMTGHLSFDFMAEDRPGTIYGTEKRIYAIECNPRAHTAVVLFGQNGPEMEEMVQAYLSAIKSNLSKGSKGLATNRYQSGIASEPIYPPANTRPRYWIGHDIVSMILGPGISLSLRHSSLHDWIRGCLSCVSHILFWKEGTFEILDPLPALALYHLYWPWTIIGAWWSRRRWSRVNVSTTKMFAC
ncbi:hypothetical protein GQ53DRAFT_819029 [Thozetella sp. PMI_491]|nr:hypothetical protein GQ53DRAFT_819029 [Thozetella sp. PMI_491]